jgi:hypothetical protein
MQRWGANVVRGSGNEPYPAGTWLRERDGKAMWRVERVCGGGFYELLSEGAPSVTCIRWTRASIDRELRVIDHDGSDQ